MGTFQYTSIPVDENQIRILRLLPAAHSSEPISIEIFKTSLDNLPEFIAFSYQWGNPELRTKIMVRNQDLSITVSLETALKYMRRPNVSELIWIDQICINQGDGAEKNAQLPLMEKIYALSTQTVGWLGEGTSQLMEAMRYLREIGVRTLEIGLKDVTASDFQAILADESDLASGIVVLDDATRAMRDGVHRLIIEQGDFFAFKPHDGLVQLCQLQYFKRGWIHQEVAIPKKLMLKCGDISLDSDTFAAGINFYLIFILVSVHRINWSFQP